MKRFFIIGNPRSGTTLFRLMLNKHSKISVPPEAGFLVWLNNRFHDFSLDDLDTLIEELKQTKKIESWKLDFVQLSEYISKKAPQSFAEVMDSIYEFYSQYVLKKEVEVFGDKNNYYLNHVDMLAGLYPEAKFIHIIRDGRSVAASYQGLMAKSIDSVYAPKLPTAITDIADEWINNIECIENAFGRLNPENVMVIRFEDLVLNPEQTLAEVCRFLELPFQDSMLEYYDTNEGSGLEPAEYMAWKSKNLKPLQTEEAEKYKLLSQDDRFQFENHAKTLLQRYKYI